MNARGIAAEFVGSFTYTMALFGTILSVDQASNNLLTIAFAPGLAFTLMHYVAAPLSGGHFNPAVTLGMVAGGHFPPGQAPAYIGAQLTGAILATVFLQMIRCEGIAIDCRSFAAVANGFGSDEQHSLLAVMLVEWLTTAILLLVFMKATSGESTATAALMIGLSITMLHLIALPISNAALNPARATAAALFADTTTLTQLWVFWVAPILGAVTGGLLARWLDQE